MDLCNFLNTMLRNKLEHSLSEHGTCIQLSGKLATSLLLKIIAHRLIYLLVEWCSWSRFAELLLSADSELLLHLLSQTHSDTLCCLDLHLQ